MRCGFKYFELVTFGILMLNGLSQIRLIDSLKLALKNAQHDTTSLELLLTLGELEGISRINYWDSLTQSSIKLANKYKKKSAEYLSIKRVQANSLNNFAYFNMQQGMIPKAIIFYNQALNLSEEIHYDNGIATALGSIGFIYQAQNEMDKAIEYFVKAKRLMFKINNLHGLAGCLKIWQLHMNH